MTFYVIMVTKQGQKQKGRLSPFQTQKEKPSKPCASTVFTGEPGGIRTHDLLIRSWLIWYKIATNNTVSFCCAIAVFACEQADCAGCMNPLVLLAIALRWFFASLFFSMW